MTKLLMMMVLICSLGVATTTSWGQAANSQATTGILGYLDPHTGAFRPLPAAVPQDDELPAATVFTGTVTVTITITVKTTTLTNFTCSAEVSVADGSTTISPVFFGETDTVAATGTGSTRTCKLSIPYSWGLTTQSTDNMQTSYNVFGTAGTAGLPQRTSSRSPLDTRKVPANGTITALTAAVTQ